MGFAIGYALTAPVSADKEAAILNAVETLSNGRTWLSCEPPYLNNKEGVIAGASKPNFMPHPDDVEAAFEEGLPDGTVNDLLDVLCELSRQFEVDWEITHDYSDGPLGFIRRGQVDAAVRSQCAAFNDLASDLGMEDFDADDL